MKSKMRNFTVLALTTLLALVVVISMVPWGAQASAAQPDAQTPDVTTLPSSRQVPTGLQPVNADELDGASIESDYVPFGQRLQTTGNYMVELTGAPLAELWLQSQNEGTPYNRAVAQSYVDGLLASQAEASLAVEALGGKTLANFTKLINGIAVEISADQVRNLMALPGVVSVSAMPDFEIHLDETVPWIGADVVQNAGFDGSGIRVAVLDSGIDYTHEHLDGCGTQACSDQALAQASLPADPALFPTSKVIGGYDFVGSVWPSGPLQPDSNPMDDGPSRGHGTHVASIIGGVATDDLGPGVAPGVEFYALKVCSSVATSCSGVAIQQAYEWAADPDGDFTFKRADVINLSLGALYGQPSNSSVAATDMLSMLGSVVVVSAGNSGNAPYISGSPSTARSAIGVAQTTVPSSVLYKIRRDTPAPVVVMDAVWQPWSAVPMAAISGDVVYGNGDGTNLNGCDPVTANLTGKISVMDRGVCAFSVKTQNAEAAGAVMSIIALVAPGDPFAGGFGGGAFPTIPAFMVSQANGNLLKVANVSATIDPTDPDLTIPLLDVMVGSSSRGPAFDLSYIKPNIGAPGASVSASSGDQSYSVFGGTSGAAPMVAGAAAQLLDQAGGRYSLAPIEVKALLMNNAVTDTWQDMPGGMLNPITRQGAGRVDVEAAAGAETLAWVAADGDVGLSFGFETVAHPYTDSKTVKVVNTSGTSKTYDIEAAFRYANDIGAGVEVTLSTNTLTVPAGGNGTFTVNLAVADPLLLKAWPFAGGSTFTNGDLLTTVEADGFVTLTATDGEVINLPWHFLPRKSSDVTVGMPVFAGGGAYDIPLDNSSVVAGTVEAFPLFDISPQLALPPNMQNASPADIQFVGADAIRWSATQNLLLFAVSTWNGRSHPINVEFDIYIDVNQDGTDDYVAYNGLAGGTGDPRPVSVLCPLPTGTCAAQFFLDSTLNSSNMVIPVVVPDADMAFDFQVFAFDAYFGGLWDTSPASALDGDYHTFDAMAPAFYPDAYEFAVPANGSFTSKVSGMPNIYSPSQIGMLYRVTNGVMEGEVFGVELMSPAWLQVAHLAPFAMDPGTAVTITLNGAPALTNFAYGDSTAYISLDPGEYDVEIFPGSSAVPAITATVELMSDTYYTAIAYGDGANQDLGLMLLEDDLTPPAPGMFHLRLGHLAAFAPGLATADVRLEDGTPVVEGVNFGDVTGYIALPAGQYDLRITAPGGSPIVINPLPVNLPAGAILSAFAAGDRDNQGLGVFALPADAPGDFLPLTTYQVFMPTVFKGYSPADWFELTVLHTNDTHARVDEYNRNGAYCAPADATAGLCIAGTPRLATVVKALRDGGYPNVLLLDAGDQFQGTLFYNVFRGDVLTMTMNYLGYDAMAIGNHEFDNGPETLASFISGANFPVLSANTDVSADPDLQGMVPPYAILERGGQQIGVIGLTTPDTSNISSPGNNITFTDPVASLQAAANALTAQGVDKIIALTHMGYDVDLDLAEQVSGVDIIVGGHSHSFLYYPANPISFAPPVFPQFGPLVPAGEYPTVVESPAGDPVLVVQAYQWGTFLGHLDVVFNNTDGLVHFYNGNPIFLGANVAKDPVLDDMLEPYREAVAELRATPVGTTTVDLLIVSGGQQICRLGECLMGNLVADAMLWKANEVDPAGDFQIAFQNGGGLRAPILAGTVTMGQVLETLPFGNAIATFELQGMYVKAALENGARLYPSANGGFAQVAGLRYTINPALPSLSRVSNVEVWNGTGWDPLDMDAMYKVVTNDFMRRGGDNYLMFRDFAVNPYDFGPLLDEALAEYFQEFSPLTPMIEGRVNIVAP
jgi:minor extracellular serine protease Vpr